MYKLFIKSSQIYLDEDFSALMKVGTVYMLCSVDVCDVFCMFLHMNDVYNTDLNSSFNLF